MTQNICSIPALTIENAGTGLKIRASLMHTSPAADERLDLTVLVPGGADKALGALTIEALDRALALITATRDCAVALAAQPPKASQ